jgi:exonuclease III
MAHDLKIVVWNANGLLNHIPEVKTFLYSNDIDIMLISETHFTHKSYLKISKYNVYHTMHPDGTAHGGTAIIIKNNIIHHVDQEYRQDCIQATTVKLEEKLTTTSVTAIYCPPKHIITEEQFENFLNTQGHRFIIGGDYNAKHPQWGARLITPRGRTFNRIIEKHHLGIAATGEPTHWPSDLRKIPDALDFAITKGITQNRIKAESCFELSSDHSPVIINVSQHNIKRKATSTAQ